MTLASTTCFSVDMGTWLEKRILLSCCLICYFLFEAIIITPVNGFGTQWILDNKSQSISLSKKSNLLFHTGFLEIKNLQLVTILLCVQVSGLSRCADGVRDRIRQL